MDKGYISSTIISSMNYGLNLDLEKEHVDGSEWTFGSLSPTCLFAVPEVERESYLPPGELQNIGEEKSGCVSRAYINALEMKFSYAYDKDLIKPENKKWLEDKGYVVDGKVTFADANVEILSGTTKTGNSLKAPIDTLRKVGLVPKHLLPQLDTFDAHYDKARLTPEITKLGEDFLKRFSINYEQVFTVSLKELLANDVVALAGYAWPRPVDGEYSADPLLPFNHCFIGYSLPMTYIFDNYYDQVDGDFIKKLVASYPLYEYGYRAYVSAQNVPTLEEVPEWQKAPLFKWLTEMIIWLFTKQGPMPEIPKEILPDPKPVAPVPVKESKLTLWADAIEAFESGGDKTAASYQRNNPGNLKATTGNFIVYQTYEAGYAALCNYLLRSATNQHQAYVREAARLKKNSSGLLTIKEFIGVYAPDGPKVNKNYSQFIATKCGVTPDTCIRDLL